MQNVHVRRYPQSHPYQGTVEPEDRSWIIFIDNKGHATFWRRAQLEVPPEPVDGYGQIVSNEIWYDVEDVVSAQAAVATGAFG